MNTLSMSLYSTLLGFGSGGSSGSYGMSSLLGLNNPLSTLVNLAQVRTNAYSQQIGADQAKITGYNQLQSAISTFQSAVAALETQAAVSPAQATSSNSAVATGSAMPTATLGAYAVNVSQVAAAQTVTSTAFADLNLTVVGSGTLTIQLGTYNAGANTFTASATPAVSINVTNGSLNGIASAINAANAGVTASVTQDAAGFHLTLVSKATGAANSFQVSVTDADGTNTNMTGLSQLSYIPTAAAGAGKNLTQTQAAQDAAFTVNGVAGTSASNTNIAAGPGLTASLSQVGSTTLTVGLSYNALQTAAQNLVNAYNAAVTTVRGMTGPGGALAADGTARSFLASLGTGIYKNFAASTPYTNLTQIGITAKIDGTFSLNTAALQTAFNTNPTAAVSLVNQAAQNFDNLAKQYVQIGGPISNTLQNLKSLVTLLQSNNIGASQTSNSISQMQAAMRYKLIAALSQQGMLAQMLNPGAPLFM
jgi:flagellar hook-associated protein 2